MVELLGRVLMARKGEAVMLRIRFSRHARRRIELYNILEDTVAAMVQEADAEPGRHELVKKVAGFSLPLKVVFDVETAEDATVITAYPLRRARK